MTNPSHQPKVVLVLTTHAQSPPILPAPQLKYDLRTVLNPPKVIRDAYTGLSKRLRDHMLGNDVFVEMLERAEAEIHATVESTIELWKADKELIGSTIHEEVDSKEEEENNDEEGAESDLKDEKEDEMEDEKSGRS